MEYSLHRLLRKEVLENIAIKRGKRTYISLMGFDTRASARSYLSHHKRKGMKGFIKKTPKSIAWQFPKVKWVVYENWD